MIKKERQKEHSGGKFFLLHKHHGKRSQFSANRIEDHPQSLERSGAQQKYSFVSKHNRSGSGLSLIFKLGISNGPLYDLSIGEDEFLSGSRLDAKPL